MIYITIIDDIKIELEKFTREGNRKTKWRKFDQSELISLTGGHFDMHDSLIYHAYLSDGWQVQFNTSQFNFLKNGCS